MTVVLHGGGPGCHSTADFAAVLALRPQRRWLCVDLPGYGDSPADPGTSRANALAGVLERLGLTRVGILAQSLGGTVALRLAAEQPGRIGRIMLIGSQPTPGTRLGAQARAEYYGGDGPSPEKMRALMASLEWHDPAGIPDATVDARYRASITPMARIPAGAEDLTGVLSTVDTPTLVVWGRHDPFAGPEYAATLADTLPRGDLAVIGRTAHHPQAERPELVAALADTFLTDRSR
ncbi:alpha/beta hydrolase [Nocardia sp. CA2R105]|uniref:alpha/beta fold hydrolase n=1 Tax=Nocardia coffeae TaxID=2873381 RepID=UPI001CA66A21|nr:alpha/beta hydrolase [Nocardia coffeae]MBY8856781.1 alpha/beta hydrolase [Nocardia coffeae]